MKKNDTCLIGAHTSTSGGLHNALIQGEEIEATTVQIFTSNQRQWQGRKLSTEVIDLWFETLDTTGLQDIMSHASYLINLGSPKKEVHSKSEKAFKEEIERCLDLDIRFLNFHPGSALDDTEEACIKRIIDSLLQMASLLKKKSLTLLLEATAGQGSCVGYRFEQLASILKATYNHLPIGVCIDTCHIFAAGYDISDQASWNTTLKEFDQIIGLKHLHALHLNDSMKPLGSRKDRHAPLGKGEIGIECFKVVMQDPKLKKLPKYLETPGGVPNWTKEIKQLRTFM